MNRIRVDINYPEAEMLQNRARLEAAYRFEYTDRAPVVLGVETRYVLPLRSVGWLEYFSDPRTQMLHQLLNQKWLIENIPDDRCTGPSAFVFPDWQNTVNASGVGCEVVFSDTETPRARPFIETPEEVDAYVPRDHTSGLWGKRLDWYHRMLDLREEFQVVFNGDEIPIQVGLFTNGDSPFMTALEMAGENLLVWLSNAPEIAHELLRKVTDSIIAVETHFRTLQGVPIENGIWLSDDPVQMISPRTYRAMVAPYTREIFDTFAPVGKSRVMHMCGRNTHVLNILLDDLHVTAMDGFGSPNPPEAYLERMSGHVFLKGNIDPGLILNGPKSAIASACAQLIETLGPGGGLIVADGYNVCPSTPIENLAVLREVAAEFGAPRGWGRAPA